jgi:hypothetical protein
VVQVMARAVCWRATFILACDAALLFLQCAFAVLSFSKAADDGYMGYLLAVYLPLPCLTIWQLCNAWEVARKSQQALIIFDSLNTVFAVSLLLASVLQLLMWPIVAGTPLSMEQVFQGPLNALCALLSTTAAMLTLAFSLARLLHLENHPVCLSDLLKT